MIEPVTKSDQPRGRPAPAPQREESAPGTAAPDGGVAGSVGRAAPATEDPQCEDTDRELLWRRARDGDRGSFETLYRHFSAPVHGLALRLSGQVAEAEELTQETFVRAWLHRERIESARHLAAWLRRVAVNLFLSGRRRAGKRVDPGEDEALFDLLAAAAGGPPVGLALDLERAVAALPERLRTVLVLFDLYGHRHAEIAEMLGIAETTSKIHLHRARKRLRKELA